jgi:Tol biopolymer transport system component
LGDDLRDHRFILTVVGQGYQFIGDVVELDRRPAGLEQDYGAAVAATPHAPASQTPGPDPVGPGLDRPRGRWWLVPTLTAVSAGILSVAMVAWLLTRPPASVSARSEAQPNVRQVTFLAGLQRNPTLSPDGRFVAFVSDQSGKSALWVQRLGEATPRQLTFSSAEDSMPDWSPDGQSIVFRSEADGGGLFVIPAQGGAAKKVAPYGYWPQWSPDGRMILFSTTQYAGGVPKYYVIDAIGGAPAALRPDLLSDFRALQIGWRQANEVSYWGRRASGEDAFCSASIQPDGSAACASMEPPAKAALQQAHVALGRFRWARTGRYLYFEGSSGESTSLWRVSVNPETSAWRSLERLTTGTTVDDDFAIAADGQHLVFSARSIQNQLWAFPFDSNGGRITGAGRALTSGGATELAAEVTRDGSKLAYDATRAGRHELWEKATASGRERFLVGDASSLRTYPVWSPDGRQLAYLKRPLSTPSSSQTAVMALSTDTGVERIVYHSTDLTMLPSDWTPDGRSLIGHCGQANGPRAICRLDLPTEQDASSLHVIASDPSRNLFQERLSRDGRWITFMAVDARDAGASTIYVMPAGGGSWVAVTDGQRYDDKPRWSPDGRAVYFVSDREGVLNVWGRRFDPATGAATGGVFRVTDFSTPNTMIATDRVRMLFALTAQQLYLPVERAKGELWMLDGLDR